MKIQFPDTQGQIAAYTITPDNPREAHRLNSTYRWFDAGTDPIGYAEFLTDHKTQTVEIGPRSTDEGGGFVLVETGITQYMDPYKKLLQDRTGHCLDAHEETINLADALGRVKATRLILDAEYRPGYLWVRAIVAAYGDFDKDDDTARYEKAEQRLQESLTDELGAYVHTPEYLPNINGTFRHNPEYGRGTRNAPRVCVDNKKVWQAVWLHWVENHANSAQRAVLGRYATYKGGDPRPGINDCQGFHVDHYNGYISWDEFNALTQAPPIFEKAEAKS